MNKFKLLVGLIAIDIILTIYCIMYLGATELYPLYPFTTDFKDFILVKILVSIICVSCIYIMRKDQYIKIGIFCLVLVYVGTFIWNVWQTANYLYY